VCFPLEQYSPVGWRYQDFFLRYSIVCTIGSTDHENINEISRFDLASPTATKDAQTKDAGIGASSKKLTFRSLEGYSRYTLGENYLRQRLIISSHPDFIFGWVFKFITPMTIQSSLDLSRSKETEDEDEDIKCG